MMSSQTINAPPATDDLKKKIRNIIFIGTLALTIIFFDDLYRLWQSFFFRLAVLTSGAIALYLALKLRKKKSEIPESTAHGSAAWTTPQELIGYGWLHHLTSDKQIIKEPGGFLLSRSSFKDFKSARLFSVELSREETTQHIIICGPTGTGKSRCFYLPNLRFTHGQSFIATDPKGELHKHTASFHASLKFAPRESDTVCFNWIPLCGTDAHLCNLLARAVVVAKGESREPFWDDAETNFLASLFAHTATFDTPTPAAMYDFLTTFEQEDLIEILVNSPSKIAKQYIRLFQSASENVRGNTALGLGSKISWLMDEKVRRFTSSSKQVYDFSQLRDYAVGIYWILSETDVAVLKPLTSLFFTYVLWSIKQKDGLPVTLYLDELANVGKIPDLDVEITVLRGRNISIVAGLQSFSQLSKVYGHHAETIFRDNFLTKILLHGLDAETAEKCSRSLGEFTHQEYTTSFSESETGKSETKSLSRNQRRLMTADEIRRLPKNEFLIVSGNNKPARFTKNYYSEPPRPSTQTQNLGETQTLNFEGIAQQFKNRKLLTDGQGRRQLEAKGQKLLTTKLKALPPVPPLPEELIIEGEIVEDEE
jgi:type IV secretory pathway TraG/TraD family ATPase VirD4